jgi:hypothetical protein
MSPPLRRSRSNTDPARRRRGRLPAVLLTDVITVEAYRGVDTWDPPRDLRCLVDEAPVALVTDAGTVIGRTIRVFAPLDADVPEGSRVTLADGRYGSAQAVAPRGATSRFPIPAHLEIVLQLGEAAPTPIGGQQVTIVHRAVTGQDVYGNDVYGETLEDVRGVAVGQIESVDSSAPGNARVRRTRTVVFPPGTQIGAQDRLIIDGQRWSIEGEPTQVEQPVLGLTAGVVVRASRTTG